MFYAKCSRCQTKLSARTRSTLLSKLRDHLWSKHRAWMISRIKAGRKAKADKNPSIQDLMRALKTGVKAGIPIIQLFDEKSYQNIKRVMDGVEPFLEPTVAVTWRAIEAFRDAVKH